MGKRKPQQKDPSNQPLVARKFPFDPECQETYEPTRHELSVLSHYIPGVAELLPSQLAYDKILAWLRAAGCESVDFRKYVFSEAVEAVMQCWKDGMKEMVQHVEVQQTELRQAWTERFTWVTATATALIYWHKREQSAIEKIMAYRAPKKGKIRLWAFVKDSGQIYDPVRDLDDIFLAVGIRLDQLFRTESLVTAEMWKQIYHKVSCYVRPDDRKSEMTLRYAFGPHFAGEPMTIEPVEILWRFCERDLHAHGFSPARTIEMPLSGTPDEIESSDFQPLNPDGFTHGKYWNYLLDVSNKPSGIRMTNREWQRMKELLRRNGFAKIIGEEKLHWDRKKRKVCFPRLRIGSLFSKE